VQDFMSSIRTNKQSLIVVAVISAMLIYLDFSFLLKAQVKAFSQANAKVTKLHSDIQAVKKNMVIIEQNALKEKTNLQVKKVATEGELLTLLEQISEIAKDNSISVSQINPQKVSLPASKTKAAQPQSSFIPVTIKLVMSCGYHKLGAFLNDLENCEYATSVEDISITPESAFTEKVQLTLKTYVKI